jgi:hypothetical protein
VGAGAGAGEAALNKDKVRQGRKAHGGNEGRCRKKGRRAQKEDKNIANKKSEREMTITPNRGSPASPFFASSINFDLSFRDLRSNLSTLQTIITKQKQVRGGCMHTNMDRPMEAKCKKKDKRGECLRERFLSRGMFLYFAKRS